MRVQGSALDDLHVSASKKGDEVSLTSWVVQQLFILGDNCWTSINEEYMMLKRLRSTHPITKSSSLTGLDVYSWNALADSSMAALRAYLCDGRSCKSRGLYLLQMWYSESLRDLL